MYLIHAFKKPVLSRLFRSGVLAAGMFIGGSLAATAQISLTATAGTPTGSFTTLSDAFTAINAGTHQGTIAISVNNNTTEPASPAALNASGQGTASYTGITIRPTATVTISGAATSGRGVIELNGADNVTINGDIAGGSTGRDMTIQVTSTNTSTAAIRLIGATTGGLGSTNINISNNIILGGSNTVTSTFGIYLGGATITTTGTGPDNDNLTIENNSIQRAYSAIYARGVASTGMLDNVVINLNSIGSDVSTNYIGSRGIDIQQANAPALTRNTIFNMKTAPGTNIAAIDLGQNTNNGNISRNLIYSINNPSTGGWGAYGIQISSATGVTNHTLSNNVIYDISTLNYSSGTTYNPYGIRITGGTNHKIYYNSVNLFGSQANLLSTASLTASLIITSSAVTGLDIRNNIFANSLTGVTGTKSYAIYAASGTTFGTINYNDYYASGTYGVLGFLASDRTDITAWRTATGQDANSISTNPQFNSNTILAPSSGSPVLAAGTPITGISIDYLGNNRSSTAPSIGAYENAGDFAGPAISYTALGNTTSTSNRSLSVTITDATGINTTSGTNPRLYYKRTTDANTFNDNTSATGGWKFVEATNSSSPFSFTIDYSKLSGGAVTAGDVIQYFVIAQDVASTPNVSVNNATLAVAPTSVGLTSTNFPATGTINSYNIAISISGTINVGTGNTYTTLTGTNGLFQAINNNVVTGNIIANITSDLTESGANSLGQWSEQGTGNYTLTIRPSGAARTISGSVATTTTGQVAGLLFLNGTDRVTIDGRVDGTGTTNGLTLSNTATTGSAAVILINGPAVGAGANNITIRNTNIIGGSATLSTIWGILAVGNDNDNITIQQNNISKSFIAVDINGTTGGITDNLLITGNTIGGDQTADYIGGVGINITQSNNATVTQNIIKNVISTSTVYADGQIGVNITTSTNPLVEKNRIYNIQYTGTGGYGGKGIYFTTTTDGKIRNNFIAGISGDGWSLGTANDEIAGIKLLSGTNTAVQYNTVYISGSNTTSSTTVRGSAALLVNAGTGLDIRNNILINSFVSSVANSKAYAFYSVVANTAYTTINANDYFAGGTQAVLAFLGSDRTTLGALQTATAQDANSITKDVSGSFVNSATAELHLAAIDTELIGVPIAGVTTDYDNETRRTPYIGADEVIPVITITQNPALSAVACAGDNLTIATDATVTFGATVSYQFQRKLSSQSTWTNVTNGGTISGANTNTLVFTGIQPADSGQYRAVITANGNADTVYSNVQTVTVYTPVTITAQPQSTVACTGNTVVLSTTATGSIVSYQWQKDGADIPNATSAQYTITNAQSGNQGTYRVRITGSCTGNTVFSNPATVTVSDAAQLVQNPPPQVFGCTGDNITIGVVATGGVGGYQWEKNGTDIPGATSAQYTITNVNAGSEGSYRVRIAPVCAGGQTITSNATQLTFRPPVAVTVQPQSTTLCTGADLTFSFTASGPVVSYQWQRNGVDIPNATTSQLMFDSVTTASNGTYRASVTGICGDVVFTNPVTLTVARPIAFSVQPESQNLCLGENTTLLVGVEGTVTNFRWQKDGVDIPGQNGQGLLLNNVSFNNAGRYRLIASSPCETITTKEIIVNVSSPTKIVKAPENTAVAIGGSGLIRVEAEASPDATYQWYRGTTPLTDNSRFAGTQSSLLTIRNVQQSDIGNDYRVVVSGRCGTATSPNFSLFVPNITITSNPENVSVCVGDNANFSASAQATQNGSTLSYQWMRGTTPLTNGGRFSGVTTSTLNIVNVLETDAAADYNVRITTNPGGASVTSGLAALVVNRIPVISTPEFTSTSVCEQTELKLIAATNGQAGLTYQWFKNGSPITTTDSMFVVNSAIAGDAGIYSVIASNSCGADTLETVVSIDTKAIISAQPQNVNIQPGGSFTLSVAATGTGTLQYQWQKGGVDIANATSATYTVQNATIADHAGAYTVKITNECGVTTSSSAQVDIVSGVEDTFVAGFRLESNEPNPFSDVTTIRFTLPNPTNVRLFVTDALGREIAVLANSTMDAGMKTVTFDAQQLNISSGVYYYTLRTDSHIFTRQMLIVR